MRARSRAIDSAADRNRQQSETKYIADEVQKNQGSLLNRMSGGTYGTDNALASKLSKGMGEAGLEAAKVPAADVQAEIELKDVKMYLQSDVFKNAVGNSEELKRIQRRASEQGNSALAAAAMAKRIETTDAKDYIDDVDALYKDPGSSNATRRTIKDSMASTGLLKGSQLGNLESGNPVEVNGTPAALRQAIRKNAADGAYGSAKIAGMSNDQLELIESSVAGDPKGQYEIARAAHELLNNPQAAASINHNRARIEGLSSYYSPPPTQPQPGPPTNNLAQRARQARRRQNNP